MSKFKRDTVKDCSKQKPVKNVYGGEKKTTKKINNNNKKQSEDNI